MLADYKRVSEGVRLRKPTLAPWQNEEEGWDCEAFVARPKESSRSKSCVPQLQASSKKIVVEFVKPISHNFAIRRTKQAQTSKKQVRVKAKINSIIPTLENDFGIEEAPSEQLPQRTRRDAQLRFFTEQFDRSQMKSPSPQLIAPTKHRFSTISVDDVNCSLKATLKLFRTTLEQETVQLQKVKSTSSAKSKPNPRSGSPNRASKPHVRPEKATIIMPMLDMLGLPQEPTSPYSFAFFRNSKLTQSLPRQPRKRLDKVKNVLPQLRLST